jgi:hypothetical protein
MGGLVGRLVGCSGPAWSPQLASVRRRPVLACPHGVSGPSPMITGQMSRPVTRGRTGWDKPPPRPRSLRKRTERKPGRSGRASGRTLRCRQSPTAQDPDPPPRPGREGQPSCPEAKHRDQTQPFPSGGYLQVATSVTAAGSWRTRWLCTWLRPDLAAVVGGCWRGYLATRPQPPPSDPQRHLPTTGPPTAARG